MLTKSFQLSIPTHISFVLHKYDYIDSIIISRLLKECKNYSSSDSYKFKKTDFINAIKSSPRLRAEIQKFNQQENTEIKPNSIYFVFNILDSLVNLDWISINVSYDKEFSRIVKYDNQSILSFSYKIEEGYINLSDLLNREELDAFNMMLIKLNAIDNNYLNRSSFFYIKASDFIDILTSSVYSSNLISISDNILNIIDPKIDEDNPLILVKTDYTIY